MTSRARLGVLPCPSGSRGDRPTIAITHPPRRAEGCSVSGGREDGVDPSRGRRGGRGAGLGWEGSVVTGAAPPHGPEEEVAALCARVGRRHGNGAVAVQPSRAGRASRAASPLSAPESPARALRDTHGPRALTAPQGPGQPLTAPQSH